MTGGTRPAGARGVRARGRAGGDRRRDGERARRARARRRCLGCTGEPARLRDAGNQDPATPWPAPLLLLAAIAAVTSRLRLVAGALIAPLRHPLLCAKELATLDLLSRGRLVVLPTVSWHRDEYAALGVRFDRRGDLLDEHLAVWRRVWSGSPASFAGRYYRFRDVFVEPQPWARVARCCGSVVRACIHGCLRGWCATGTASIRLAGRRLPTSSGCELRCRRRAAIRTSSSSSAARGRSSRTRPAPPTSVARSRRCPSSSRPGSPPSA